MNYKISSFFSDFCATKLGSNFVFLFLQKLVPKLATFVNWPEKQTLQDTKPEKQKKRTKTSFCSQLLCAYKVVSEAIRLLWQDNLFCLWNMTCDTAFFWLTTGKHHTRPRLPRERFARRGASLSPSARVFENAWDNVTAESRLSCFIF